MTRQPLVPVLLGLMLGAAGWAGAAEDAPPARLEISGYGWMGNRQLKNMLRLLSDRDAKPTYFEPNFIEDAALLLFSRVQSDGYLKPQVRAVLELDGGQTRTFTWTDLIGDPLPRPLRARIARFEIRKGELYHYEEIAFSGLQSLPEKEARSFFMDVGALFLGKRNRVFTPEKLQRSLANLEEHLHRQGHAQATAFAAEEVRDPQSGAVRVTVAVTEGPMHRVRSVRLETYHEGDSAPFQVSTNAPDEPFSRIWVQDFSQDLKRRQYALGYPDANVEVQTIAEQSVEGIIQRDLLVQVRTGPKIHTGSVRFEGLGKTKEAVLARRIPLEAGDLLDRTAAEEGRYRLVRLGIFDSVALDYPPVDESTRDALYQVIEGRSVDVSMLFGFGSYELLRGGFELDQRNVFGRAHHARFRAIQSFKSSSADYTYNLPELVGEEIDVFINAKGLRRKEISFTREEFGGGVGARAFIEPIASDLSLRYSYEVLNAAEVDAGILEGPRKAQVGAVTADLRHDRRDNPLYPRSGYQLAAQLELAGEYLGGDANYARLELSGSYHLPLQAGRWLHLGLAHGIAFALHDPKVDLPFNKRFFPGGENSIRGFQQGEAAPRNAAGRLVGAETYLATNLEFEQALTPQWSVVAFFDSASFARELADYPLDEHLFSVGGGLRWKTLIGPIRLEYGYNLNRREKDPAGTLHFSIGFPF